MLCAALGLVLALAGRTEPAWLGAWSYDLCHEDRLADHDKDSFCRQGKDRILVSRRGDGALDITLCPADPWGERSARLEQGGRVLAFRTRDGLDVRLTLGEDRSHFRGRFRGKGGHGGRVWGRRLAGCGA
ncbi:MAG TPA: hypothetical protein VJV23_08895 [Candidatus Polarisedimenticolia bacterium]|nr:hypothetical protein [Candidatus Polarisedimenticolia bacterium]